jgi:hypothetical protein
VLSIATDREHPRKVNALVSGFFYDSFFSLK